MPHAPVVVEELAESGPLLRLAAQAVEEQLLVLGRDVGAHLDLEVDDLLLALERQLAVAHVVEQDAERPRGRRLCHVLLVLDVLRRLVLTRAVEVAVVVLRCCSRLLLLLVLVVVVLAVDGRGAEVDEHELHGVQVDEYVLGLDVAMHDTVRQQVHVDAHQLAEEVTRLGLAEAAALLRLQVVEQVHAVGQLGHGDDPLVLLLVEVEHLHDARHVRAHLVQQHLGRILLVVHHEPVLGLVLGYELDDDRGARRSMHALVDLREAAVAYVSAERVGVRVRRMRVRRGRVGDRDRVAAACSSGR